MLNILATKESVQEYYGKVLKSSADLKTSACCSTEAIPTSHKRILSQIDDEILTKFYGCGSPLPAALEGCAVLDLGCGTGRDVYLASALVGETGHVTGIDMTDEQLEVARRHRETQTAAFGLKEPNVTFVQGYIEDLAAAGIADNSIDVVISNCVINLSPDKHAVLSEIFRVLKPGGELYFSDVYCDRRIPAELLADPILYGECLSGALYVEDFRRILAQFGSHDPRMITTSPIDLTNAEVAQKLAGYSFESITFRAFKSELIEDRCEDYGQVAWYLGTMPDHPQQFELDAEHVFITNKPALVCGNTTAMLQETRYGKHFRIDGDRSAHYGLFNAAAETLRDESTPPSSCC